MNEEADEFEQWRSEEYYTNAGKPLTVEENEIRQKHLVASMDVFMKATALISNKRKRMKAVTRNKTYTERNQQIITSLLDNEISKINLSGQYFSASLKVSFAQALKTNTSLQEISLNSTNFGLEDDSDSERQSPDLVTELAKALSTNLKLHILELRSANIADAGVKHLAKALVSNSSLYSLDLSDNEFGNEGALAISSALKQNSSLRMLKISGNWKIREEGCRALAESLRETNTLERFSFIGIRESHVQYFERALDSNHSLIELELFPLWGLRYDELIGPIDAKLRRNKETKFFRVLNSCEKAPWNRSRVMFVGKGRAGKTATLRSLLGKTFNAETISTIGAEVSEAISIRSQWQTTETTAEFASKFAIDLAFSKEPRGEKDMVEQRKNAVIPVQYNRRKNSVPRSVSDHTSAIVGTKVLSSDASPERLSPNTTLDAKGCRSTNDNRIMMENLNIIREFDEQLLVKVAEERGSLTLSLWDFGGQEVFYSMHNVFLANSGIYVLVFDLRELAHSTEGDDSMESLLFWSRSIKLHSPSASLILVGTFCYAEPEGDLDCFGDIKRYTGRLRRINQMLTELSTRVGLPRLVRNIHDDLCFFPIDNKESLGISKLRFTIERTARRDMSFQQVPMRWMALLDSILLQKDQRSFLPLCFINETASKIGINSTSEVESALALFHERGILVHLTATEVLKNIIVIKPQWLIDGVSKVIRDKCLHSFDMEEIWRLGLQEDLNMMFSSALITRDFLEYVWNRNQVSFFLDLMKRTMLLSQWTFMKEETYLVPSLLNIIHSDFPHGIRCVFDFSTSFLPHGIFGRLICLCVEKSADNKTRYPDIADPELYANFGIIEFEPGLSLQVLEERNTQSIVLYVVDYEKATKSFTILQAMIRKLNSDVMSSGLTWITLLEDPSTGKFLRLDEARQCALWPWVEEDLELPAHKIKHVDLFSFLKGF